jgi:hypothetical protein
VGFTEVGDAKQGAEGVAAHRGVIIPEACWCAGGPVWCADRPSNGPTVRPSLKTHHVQNGVGHYGVFSGRKWNQQIDPRVRDTIHSASA